MPRQVSIAHAKDQLTRLVRGVERGEVVELTRRGRPVAALVSISEYRRVRGAAGSFWSALREFREQRTPRELEEITEALTDLRDRTVGRRVRL